MKKINAHGVRHRAAEILCRDGVRITLAMSLMMCALTAGLPVVLEGALSVVLGRLTNNGDLIFLGVKMLDIVLILWELLLTLPLVVRYGYVAYRSALGEKTTVGDLFEVFSSSKDYKKALRAAVPAIICYSPVLVFYFVLDEAWRIWICLALATAMFLFYTAFWSFYPLVSQIFGEYSLWDAMKKGIGLPKGHRFNVIVYRLTFVGWILIGILSIGTVYVIHTGPLMALSNAVYTENLISEKEM